ncbi:PIG-L deacetylase family protein [Actinoplanes regularis]|uniref:PIG-L deacetylase family protein n=1 Tax=Actinoplanes regularis TaxID=52697 RepID=UPI0024A5E3EB|nr:PIG-L family deacetylase [Actinoplanes regularis]GLW35490.1 PIG-L family deacetylase [Actinoplanes regularis]
MSEHEEQRTGMSRRRLLAAGALTAAAGVAQQSLWPSVASAAAKPAIFYSPHQDDEAIGMAGSIQEHKAAGRPVYLVLVTLGKNVGLPKIMNEGACSRGSRCASPNDFHNLGWPTDGISKVVPARTAEFMASAKALGVDKVINWKLPETEYNRFVDTVTAKVKALAEQYPGASHKFVAGWMDKLGSDPANGTHKACSDAAYRLMNDGTLTDVRFNHIYAYNLPMNERGRGAAHVLNIPDSHMKAKRNAIYAYNTWDPDRNFYALGYHSVDWMLEAAHYDAREFVYTLPSNYRPGQP